MLLDTNYFFATEYTEYLLGVLNSKLIMSWINSEDTPIGNGGAYRHYKYNLERLHIPLYTNNTIQEKIVAEVKRYIQSGYNGTINIDSLVNDMYGLNQYEKEFINSL